MDYPEEWNQLPKRERKKKLKELRREQERKTGSVRFCYFILTSS